jgi:hypothetical protein
MEEETDLTEAIILNDSILQAPMNALSSYVNRISHRKWEIRNWSTPIILFCILNSHQGMALSDPIVTHMTEMTKNVFTSTKGIKCYLYSGHLCQKMM